METTYGLLAPCERNPVRQLIPLITAMIAAVKIPLINQTRNAADGLVCIQAWISSSLILAFVKIYLTKCLLSIEAIESHTCWCGLPVNYPTATTRFQQVLTVFSEIGFRQGISLFLHHISVQEIVKKKNLYRKTICILGWVWSVDVVVVDGVRIIFKYCGQWKISQISIYYY